jgi:hypothetical protein
MRSLNSLIHSTGIKMFLILTLALLPLGLIALIASLQAIRTADLEKEALLRVSVTRKLTTDLASDRTALMLTANALSTGSEGPEMCERLAIFLTSHDREGGRYYIYDRSGRRLCGSSQAEPVGLPQAARFHAAPAQLLPASGYLLSRAVSNNRCASLLFPLLSGSDHQPDHGAAKPAVELASRRATACRQQSAWQSSGP